MRRRHLTLLVLVALGWAHRGFSLEQRTILSLEDALRQAERTHPGLKASDLERVQAEDQVTISRSALLPHLDLSAVDSWGMTGSSTPLPLQFGGLMASPFRIGAAAGLLGSFTILDIGNLRAVDEAQGDLAASREQLRSERMNIDQTAAQLYLDAAEIRSEWETWRELVQGIEPVLSHVRKFVRNGQYSEVQGSLIRHQLQNAENQRDIAQERYRAALERLRVFIGHREGGIECLPVTELGESALKAIAPGASSPLVTHAEAQAEAAEARASRFSAERLPRVYALGSVGLLEGTQLVGKQDYSAWLGVTLPLFEGFRISGEIHQARAQAEQRQELLSAARLALDDLNVQYQVEISTARTQLRYLIREQEETSRAFTLARQRYFRFVEPLANLIQAINDLNEVRLQLNQARARLLAGEASRLLVNGATIR